MRQPSGSASNSDGSLTVGPRDRFISFMAMLTALLAGLPALRRNACGLRFRGAIAAISPPRAADFAYVGYFGR